MKDFGKKYINYTTLAKCPICGVKVELVVNPDGEHIVILEHKSECEHFHLNQDLSQYTRFPVTEEEIEIMRKFKNREI